MFGFHRMSSSCIMGATGSPTASGGVTFMRVFSSVPVSDPDLLHRLLACLLFAWTNFHVSFAIAAPTHANVKVRCVALAQVRPGCSNLF